MDRRVVACLLVAWAVLQGGARAAEPRQTTETYGEWTVRCVPREALPPCDMLQVTVEQATGRQVLRLSLAHLGKGDRIGVQAWVPLGVWVSAGVRVQADGKTVELDGSGSRGARDRGASSRRWWRRRALRRSSGGRKGDWW